MNKLCVLPSLVDKFRREHNFKMFKHQGFTCIVVRQRSYGHYCGYVALPEGHPFYGKNGNDYIKVENAKEIPIGNRYIQAFCLDPEKLEKGEVTLGLFLQVHGGITYSEYDLVFIDEECTGKVWWLGFDCDHCDDLAPFTDDPDWEMGTYKDFDYVLQEVKSLAEQLFQASKTKNDEQRHTAS